MRAGMRYSLPSNLRPLTSKKAIIHHEIERSREIGHIAAESRIGVDGNLEAVQVHAIVRGEEFLNIGILIAFHLFRWEALPAEVLEGLITHSIHRLRSMREDQLPRLLVQLYILLLTLHLSPPLSNHNHAPESAWRVQAPPSSRCALCRAHAQTAGGSSPADGRSG